MVRKRLDRLLVEKGLAPTRQRAQALILSGRVYIDETCRNKAGALVAEDSNVTVKGDLPFVSRGGLKLSAALSSFSVSVAGLVCLDVGASTGGFTDCLLQNGARLVIAVDVGYGQFAWKLRQDPRVFLLERTNIRYLSPAALPCPARLAVIDVSFISLRLVIPAVLKLVVPGAHILALVKPQFEVGKGEVGKKGVVRDPAKHEKVLENIKAFAGSLGLLLAGQVPSPVPGPEGNREFFMFFKSGPN